ncbi:MAG: hypothetical protein MUF34_33780 [Polyangiaceae bacterium]|jgi:hypothetical protein|nr:hypothetical protein [Polyangiaceae bacterium]
MKRPALVVVAVATVLASFVGCKKKEPQPPQPLTPATGYPTAGYPTAPVAGPPPSPLSPACQQLEGTCAWARCNMTAGRCAFPCGSDADCIQNARCVGAGTALAVCAPASVPGMTPAPAPTQPTM